jgi:hypothetical protein
VLFASLPPGGKLGFLLVGQQGSDAGVRILANGLPRRAQGLHLFRAERIRLGGSGVCGGFVALCGRLLLFEKRLDLLALIEQDSLHLRLLFLAQSQQLGELPQLALHIGTPRLHLHLARWRAAGGRTARPIGLRPKRAATCDEDTGEQNGPPRQQKVIGKIDNAPLEGEGMLRDEALRRNPDQAFTRQNPASDRSATESGFSTSEQHRRRRCSLN